jgi:hypothetical protein
MPAKPPLADVGMSWNVGAEMGSASLGKSHVEIKMDERWRIVCIWGDSVYLSLDSNSPEPSSMAAASFHLMNELLRCLHCKHDQPF